MGIPSRHRAPVRRRSFFASRRNRWILAYLAIVATVAGVGNSGFFTDTVLTTPTQGRLTESNARPSLISEAKSAALFAPTLKGSLSSVSNDALHAGLNVTGSGTAKDWYSHFGQPRTARLEKKDVDRFDQVVVQAALSPEKLANVFKKATPRKKHAAKAATVASAEPSADRFNAPLPSAEAAAPIILAYADSSPASANDALDAVSALALNNRLAPNTLGVTTAPVPEVDVEESFLPDAVPLPLIRPKAGKPDQPLLRAEPKADPEEEKAQPKLAFAKPEDPSKSKKNGGIGNSLKDLFGARPKAGNGVAVYDISAARVYMPDGSVLEAHSGIGKMADNPKYVHVKMNGPTPPHTYNLKMREKRFHGVEAIRMLPVDGKNKHGRDGFLTHSYLLRGGRAESHGCVAFKDYQKFLKAFKQGKVRQLVVVPGGGKARFQLAKNGEGA